MTRRGGIAGRRGFRGWTYGGDAARAVRCGLESFAVLVRVKLGRLIGRSVG